MSQILSPNTIRRRTALGKAGSGLVSRRRCNSYVREDEDEEPAEEDKPESATGVGQTTSASCETGRTSEIIPTTTTANSSNNSNSNNDDAIAQVMKRSQWKINTSLESKRANYETICSICFLDTSKRSRNDDERRNPLLTPCLCLGSRARQHKRCIEEWIEETGAVSCPFCFVRYEYTRKRKSFWSYLKDCELERDFVVSLTAFALSLYLFLVGLSICYHYVMAADYFGWRPTNSSDDDKCQSSLSSAAPSGCLNDLGDNYDDDGEVEADEKSTAAAAFAVAVEKLSRATQQFVFHNYAQTWLFTSLFCFACIASVLLLIGMVSMSLELMIRHYVSYSRWSEAHFNVSVAPYTLAAGTLTTSVRRQSGATRLSPSPPSSSLSSPLDRHNRMNR